MGGRKKRGGGSVSPAPTQIVKAGETTGGENFGGSLSAAKNRDKKKGTLADEQAVGVLAQALVEKLGQ